MTVSAELADLDGVASVALWYSVAGGTWASVPMQPGADGRRQALVPRQEAGATVQFYVQAEDRLGAQSTFPAAGAGSRALWRVVESDPGNRDVQLLRLIMTQEDVDLQHTRTNVMSNDRLGATVVYNDREVFYDVGVRLRASGVGRTGPRAGFNVRFHSDRLFRGVQRTVVIDRSVTLTDADGNWGGLAVGLSASPHELLFDQVANRAGGIPAMLSDVVFLEAPRAMNTGLAALKLARYSNDFLDSQFDHGGDGPLFKFDLIYFSDETADGSPEGLKGRPNGVRGNDIRDMGDDKEAYRYNFIPRNHRDAAALVLALKDRTHYEQRYGHPPWLLGDADGDGDLAADDRRTVKRRLVRA